MNSATASKDLLTQFQRARAKFQELFHSEEFLTRLKEEIDRKLESNKQWFIESQVSTLDVPKLRIAKQVVQDLISPPRPVPTLVVEEKRNLVAANPVSPTIQELPKQQKVTNVAKGRKSR